MSSHEFAISDEIKTFVTEILSKNNFAPTSEIKYYPGSEVGEGYGSKTIAVDITDETKSLNLFLKCPLTVIKHQSFNAIYATEIKWYKTIYPAYRKFLTEKNTKNGFINVPMCYGVLEKSGYESVALENLRKRNFKLFDKSKFMNDEHLKLTLETFAKFHAISFALKDQQRQAHDYFIGDRPNIIVALDVLGYDKVILNMVKQFVAQLDPVEDKDILERCNDVPSKVIDQFLNMEKYLSDYSILTKGDCWINNMMFLYEANFRNIRPFQR